MDKNSTIRSYFHVYLLYCIELKLNVHREPRNAAAGVHTMVNFSPHVQTTDVLQKVTTVTTISERNVSLNFVLTINSFVKEVIFVSYLICKKILTASRSVLQIS